jgi:ubiquinone biosynthesis protein
MSKTLSKNYAGLVERFVRGPEGFRQTLEEMGPTFIKLGQFLAMRPDIIPQRYCNELLRLLDRVPPFPWEQARATIAEDLGADPREIFRSINPRPIATGSLAQTHLARLHGGEEVAVKVQRPDIRAAVERDLRRARRFGRLLDLSGASLILNPREAADELSRWMREELDFKRELSNVRRLYRLTRRSEIEVVPRPYDDLCGPRVLTLEFLRGLPVSDLLGALHAGRTAEVERIEAIGVDRDRLAENLMRATLRQIFRYQFFHADLHPGNLIVLPDGAIGFVDFGLCDELDETIREGQLRYLAAVYSGDAEQIYKATVEVLEADEGSNLTSFRRDVLDRTQEWISKRGGDGGPRPRGAGREPPLDEHNRSPVATWMIGVMRSAHRNRLRVPARVLSMYRALLTAETVARQLGTDVDLGAIGRRFFRQLRIEETSRLLEPDRIEPVILNTINLWRDSPRQVHQLLSDLADGRYVLNVSARESPSARRARDRRARLVATSVLTVGLSLLLAAPQMPAPFGVSLRWFVGAALALLYLKVFTQWRRMR